MTATMKTKPIDNIKLGLFVIAGLAFLIVTLYMIGKNRNLFGTTFTISASMTSVNGLTRGNNVRFKGIDVGTVKDIQIAGDSAVLVVMIIDEKVKPHIKQNSIASIGTDGLMGSRLINISTQPGPAPPVREGSIIRSREPVETDEMLRTLNTTNNTIERVTRNLDEITTKLNSSKSLWNLISDTLITSDLQDAVSDFRDAGAHTAALTASAKEIVNRFKSGDGLAGALFTDTTLTRKLDSSMTRLQLASEKTAGMMDDLESVMQGLKSGDGTAGLLLSDTVLRNAVMRSGLQVEQGTTRFNENMEALKSNFLFRRYFRKLEKQRARDLKRLKGNEPESPPNALSSKSKDKN
jgi:phospholipid/cholesterol/gamma-HCH transport system substrate-binding protein